MSNNTSKGRSGRAGGSSDWNSHYDVYVADEHDVTVSVIFHLDVMSSQEVLWLIAHVTGELFSRFEGYWPMEASVMQYLLNQMLIETVEQRRLNKRATPF